MAMTFYYFNGFKDFGLLYSVCFYDNSSLLFFFFALCNCYFMLLFFFSYPFMFAFIDFCCCCCCFLIFIVLMCCQSLAVRAQDWISFVYFRQIHSIWCVCHFFLEFFGEEKNVIYSSIKYCSQRREIFLPSDFFCSRKVFRFAENLSMTATLSNKFGDEVYAHEKRWSNRNEDDFVYMVEFIFKFVAVQY